VITIIVDTDAEEARLRVAMQDGTLSSALAAAGCFDFQLAHREAGRPPRPFGGAGRTSIITMTTGGTMASGGAGGGGGGGTVRIVPWDNTQRHVP
jgi:hypothetical protein